MRCRNNNECVTYRMCEGGGRDDGVGVVRGGGGVGGAGGPSMGPEPGAHLRVAQHAGQQCRHQHGRQHDHQHVQAAHCKVKAVLTPDTHARTHAHTHSITRTSHIRVTV